MQSVVRPVWHRSQTFVAPGKAFVRSVPWGHRDAAIGDAPGPRVPCALVGAITDSLGGVRRWLLFLVVVLSACSQSAPLPSITEVGSAAPSTTSLVTAPANTDSAAPDAERGDERADMVDTHIAARGISDPIVLGAMREVPRHHFVPAELSEQAYRDSALPIGYGQTISQPYIVALMSDALDVEPGDKVLEIGTGSGYQAAVLAAMGCEVYTMEIIPELANRAQRTLSDSGYDATVANADGYFGWEEHAPFDGIIVTAAPDHVPQPLIDQLGEEAALVIPVGPIGAVQTMWRFSRDETGQILGQNLGPVLFVPFTRADE